MGFLLFSDKLCHSVEQIKVRIKIDLSSSHSALTEQFYNDHLHSFHPYKGNTDLICFNLTQWDSSMGQPCKSIPYRLDKESSIQIASLHYRLSFGFSYDQNVYICQYTNNAVQGSLSRKRALGTVFVQIEHSGFKGEFRVFRIQTPRVIGGEKPLFDLLVGRDIYDILHKGKKCDLCKKYFK